jgi:hypothetical protein
MANALAELVGLGASSLLWLFYFMGMEDRLGTLWAALIVVGGSTLFEGSAVGLAQWRILRQPLRELSLRSWWAATTLGALVAWTLGMVPSTMMALSEQTTQSAPPPELSDALVYSLAAAMGLALGPILALPQWWVLRRYVDHAWQWIPANAVAWALGMTVIFVVISLMPSGTPSVRTILFLLAGLTLTGAVVGAVHGVILVRLLPRSSHTDVAS